MEDERSVEFQAEATHRMDAIRRPMQRSGQGAPASRISPGPRPKAAVSTSLQPSMGPPGQLPLPQPLRPLATSSAAKGADAQPSSAGTSRQQGGHRGGQRQRKGSPLKRGRSSGTPSSADQSKALIPDFSMDSSSWPSLGSSAAGPATPASAPTTPSATSAAQAAEIVALLHGQLDAQQELLEAAVARAADAEKAAAAAQQAAEEEKRQAQERQRKLRAELKAAKAEQAAAEERASKMQQKLAAAQTRCEELAQHKELAEQRAATAQAAGQELAKWRAQVSKELIAAQQAAAAAHAAQAAAQAKAAAAEHRLGQLQQRVQAETEAQAGQGGSWQARALNAEVEVARLQQMLAQMQWGWQQAA